ncbi:hypothetical protein ABW19_dt0200712 [Dactylella cylindrospora]|nr:hypothetical protein ABW19_dt0200712 [Dactylella cylindrospora]
MTLTFNTLENRNEARQMWEETLRTEKILFIGSKLEAFGCSHEDHEEDRFFALTTDKRIQSGADELEVSIQVELQDVHKDGLYRKFDLNWGTANPNPRPIKRFDSAKVARAQQKRQEVAGSNYNMDTVPYFVMDPEYTSADPETGLVWNDTVRARKNNANMPAPWEPEELMSRPYPSGMGNFSGWYNKDDGSPYTPPTPITPTMTLKTVPTPSDVGIREFYLSQFKAEEGYLVGSTGGSFFLEESDEEIVYQDPLSPRAFVYERGLIFADFQGRFIHIYQDELDKYGVSRLRAHTDTNTPATARYVELVANDGGFSFAVDTLQNKYALVVCTYEGNEVPPKIFVVESLTEGTSRLEQPDLENIITGGSVTSCEGLSFTFTDLEILREPQAPSSPDR